MEEQAHYNPQTNADSVREFVEKQLAEMQNFLVRKPELALLDRLRILREMVTISAQLIELKRLASNQPYSNPTVL